MHLCHILSFSRGQVRHTATEGQEREEEQEFSHRHPANSQAIVRDTFARNAHRYKYPHVAYRHQVMETNTLRLVLNSRNRTMSAYRKDNENLLYMLDISLSFSPIILRLASGAQFSLSHRPHAPVRA